MCKALLAWSNLLTKLLQQRSIHLQILLVDLDVQVTIILHHHIDDIIDHLHLVNPGSCFGQA